VLPQTGLSETVTRVPIDIRRFPWIKRLATDYACDYAKVAGFFAGNPHDPAAWTDVIARTQRHSRQRDAIADILAGQQSRRSAPPEAVAAAQLLRDPRTVAVVTGQQAGLFGGPMYTLLKALTAIKLAERTAAEHQVPTVAIFWIDAEDHDWNEVKACNVLDASLTPTRIAIEDPPGAGDRPVGQIALDDSCVAALDRLATTLPPTEHTPALLEGLRKAYAPGLTMSEAFGRWLETLLGRRGLVVFDSSDKAAKPLVSAVFAREIEQIGETSRLAGEAGQALTDLGYHTQVAPHEGQAAIFRVDGGRSSIRADNGGLAIGDVHATREAVLQEVRTNTGAFSPNVLLRPLVQDTLFPTICYVGGPSETAYLAQLRHVYAAFGVPMPLVQQRASATIFDSNAMRFLQRHALPLEALRAQDEAALNELLKAQIPPAVDASLEEAARAVTECMDCVAEEVAQLDQTLEAAARSTLGRMQDDLKKLHGKIIQAAKRKDETLRRQFVHAQAQAFPNGHPQEREIGLVYFVNKYGSVLVDRLSEELPLDQGSHWVVTI
jgi:bacillithiol biosynthesis cysteine-adding enzyme BshC